MGQKQSTCCCAADDASLTIDAMAAGSPRPMLQVKPIPDEPLKPVAEVMKAQAEAPTMQMAPPPPPAPKAKAPEFGPADYAGGWQDTKQNKVYILQGSTLTWSSVKGHNSDIKCSGGKMLIEGGDMVGTLDEAKAQLTWNDGDVWNRAGVDGCWKKTVDGPSMERFHIEGDTILTVTNNGKELTRWKTSLDRMSSTSIMMEKTVATLDALAVTLTWSDGDVWTRTFRDEDIDAKNWAVSN